MQGQKVTHQLFGDAWQPGGCPQKHAAACVDFLCLSSVRTFSGEERRAVDARHDKMHGNCNYLHAGPQGVSICSIVALAMPSLHMVRSTSDSGSCYSAENPSCLSISACPRPVQQQQQHRWKLRAQPRGAPARIWSAASSSLQPRCLELQLSSALATSRQPSVPRRHGMAHAPHH